MNNDLTLNNILYIDRSRAEAKLVTISRAVAYKHTVIYFIVWYTLVNKHRPMFMSGIVIYVSLNLRWVQLGI